MTDASRTLKRNAVANFAGQGWSAVMGLAFLPVYIRYLGIEAYALIGFFAMLSAWLSLLDLGMTQTLGREFGQFTGGQRTAESVRDLLRTVELLMLGIVVLVIVAFFFAGEWIATNWLQSKVLTHQEIALAIFWMGAVIGFRFFENAYRACLLGLQQHVAFNVANAAFVTLRWLGAVGVLAWVEPSITAFFVWQGSVALLASICLGFLTYRNLPAARGGRFDLRVIHEIRHFAGGMFGASLLAFALTQVDKILLSKLLTLADFGYYTLASTVAGGIFMLATPVIQTFYPRLCELHAKRDERAFGVAFQQAARLMNVIAASAAIILIVHAPLVLGAWTHNPELTARTSTLLSILTFGNLMNALMLLPYQATLAHGWAGFAVRVNAVAIALLVPAVFLVAPSFGSVGVAWIWVALNAGYLLVATTFLFRNVLPGQRGEWSRRIGSTLAGGFAIAIVFRALEGFVGSDLLVQLALSGVAAAAVLAYSMHVNGRRTGDVAVAQAIVRKPS